MNSKSPQRDPVELNSKSPQRDPVELNSKSVPASHLEQEQINEPVADQIKHEAQKPAQENKIITAGEWAFFLNPFSNYDVPFPTAVISCSGVVDGIVNTDNFSPRTSVMTSGLIGLSPVAVTPPTLLPHCPPRPDFIPSHEIWTTAWVLSQLADFTQLLDDLIARPAPWTAFLDHEAPVYNGTLLGDKWVHLSSFQLLLVVRTLAPARTLDGVKDYICSSLGAAYLSFSNLNLAACYAESSAAVPLLFMLPPAANDPSTYFYRFAEERGMTYHLDVYSLGRSTTLGNVTELILRGSITGSWVFLQNCHIAPEWLTTLEATLQRVSRSSNTHPRFRLWLSSGSTPGFPISVLQQCVKIVVQPANDLKDAIRGTLVPFAHTFGTGIIPPVDDSPFHFSTQWYDSSPTTQTTGTNIPLTTSNPGALVPPLILSYPF